MRSFRTVLTLLFLLTGSLSFAQDSLSPFSWTVTSRRLAEGRYELQFRTPGQQAWDLYSPTQQLNEVPTAELAFTDSAIRAAGSFTDSGKVNTIQSSLFEQQVKLQQGAVTWKQVVEIKGAVPARLQGTLLYTYGRGEAFYPSTAFPFSVALEGGVEASTTILEPAIDVRNPVSPCGDEDTGNKSLWTLFLIGLGAGLLALLFPCVFPLIPLTVSYFTKRSKTRRQGIVNAVWYGTSIFLIYTLLSLPFHLFNVQPEVLNNISTNVPLNLFFFVIFVVFAISFFGYFEITLPGSLASKTDSKAGLSSFGGIFFMALTLAIVSFSCTSGILGALLVGAIGGENGAWQLTAGMGGFGLGLGLPFVLFALFPGWLQSLPRSGGWMNELKAVFGFIELAMAVKFLSNADLVKQWYLLPREVFIGIWIAIGLATVLYLAGVIRFKGDDKPTFTPVRWAFILLFGGLTAYLIPGLTNTAAARLPLVSGFPPPFTYSLYKPSVNYQQGVKPLHNEYEKALELAKAQNKPVLIDFTGWACVNCRRMEEKVWVDEEVRELMNKEFIVLSLFVDERKALPVSEQVSYTTRNGDQKNIVTVGDKWATFQAENFFAVSQPQYAIISPDKKALTKTKGYTPSAREFADWLKCGLEAFRRK
jgi:cytochrome c biogenesis protein CcdA/thioredoxin-related protein